MHSLNGSTGAFAIAYGFISVKIKQVWYLGEACNLTTIPPAAFMGSSTDNAFPVPAVVFGIILGPIAAKFLDATRWGAAVTGQEPAITLVS
jgi:hypothetical protein